MKEWKDYTLTVEGGDGKIEVIIPQKCTISEIVPFFRAILTWMEYHQESIDSIFSDELKELKKHD